jgi:hypothetical protein
MTSGFDVVILGLLAEQRWPFTVHSTVLASQATLAGTVAPVLVEELAVVPVPLREEEFLPTSSAVDGVNITDPSLTDLVPKEFCAQF